MPIIVHKGVHGVFRRASEGRLYLLRRVLDEEKGDDIDLFSRETYDVKTVRASCTRVMPFLAMEDVVRVLGRIVVVLIGVNKIETQKI